MEPESISPPSTRTLLGSTTPPANGQRVTNFLRKAELWPPQRIPTLVELPVLDCEPSVPSNADAARTLLVEQRIGEPGYRQPERRTRRIFWTPSRRKSEFDRDTWIFTKLEVAKALDGLLSHEPLAAPGTAQALLLHASAFSLDELWCHLSDQKVEKRTTSRFRRSRLSLIPEIPWLDQVTRQGNVEYIHLLCQTGVGQEALDRAFNVALSKHSMPAMEVLLGFGASASACQDAIRDRIKLNDIALARLLLSAPSAMSVEAWRYCVEPECESLQASGKQSPTILLLCLTHRPDVVCGLLLINALKSQNFQATAIILAHARIDEDFRNFRQLACQLATHVQDNGRRHQFFEILDESGLLEDGPILREELMKDVKTHQLPMVQLLAKAGISLDTEPYNAIYWTVSHMNLDILELFGNGNFSSPISLALNLIPDSTSEQEVLRLVEILAPKGLAGEPLDSYLIRAVRKHQFKLVDTLLRYGASVEFERASAIQIALENADFNILSSLLRSKCSPEILSSAISTALTLQPWPTRLQAFKALVEKGVLNQELGVAIQRLVSEAGDLDSQLIRFLLQHKAPVDKVDDDARNAVLLAVRRGNLAVLKMLCDAEPRNETLSKALPIAFGMIYTCGYNVALIMIKLLLSKGAGGLPAHQTLLTAAKQDYKLDIVHLLVQYGADANYATGASFTVALATANFKLLQILCSGCPPSQASLERVLLMAIDPRYYNLQALELLLSSSPSSAAALNILGASEEFRSNPNLTEFIPCCLQYGLGVDLGDGFLLRFAVQEKKFLLLCRILSTNPSIDSLRTAFHAISSVEPTIFKFETMRLLLEHANSAEIGQSRVILQQTRAALVGDLESLQLLVRHKAVVDLDDGKAVEIAAAAGSLEVLDLLLSCGPAPYIINKACLAAASSAIGRDQKKSVLKHLLAANGGLPPDEMSKLLADSVSSLPECTQLPQLLLAHHVKVQVGTLKVALDTSSHELFVALAKSIRNTSTVVRMFRHARKITMIPTRRHWIYQHLLARGDGCIPNEDVCKALIDFLKAGDLGDFSVPKLLLEHGALVGYKNGEAFSMALRANSLEAVKLLSQYLLDDHTAGVIFDRALKTTLLDREVRIGVYRCLLQWKIRKSSMYHALVENLEGGHSDIPTLQLLLAKGADPNKDEARCFILAAKAGATITFRILSRHAKLSVVLKTLLKHFKTEGTAVWWFTACLEEQPQPPSLPQGAFLFKCMRMFPRGTALLELLLNHGLSISGETSHRLCAGWHHEPCTALIWALFSLKPRIENDAILLLLRRGRKAVLPAYATPRTKVSAAFGCLLDKTRTPILEALLDLDRDGLLDYKVPGSSLGYLGAHPAAFNPELSFLDISEELPLRLAALYLGNFDAFRLLNIAETPDDTTLHLAALMALPRFVEWLLTFHNPDYKAEDFDMMIPLALVCESKPHLWCKIANEEADWKTRQKATMRLLAAKTSPKWRSRSRTVLHIALENGLDTTKAMVEAIGYCHDPDKDEKYAYVDKDGIQYAPQQYVMKFLDADEQEKKALVTCLADYKCYHAPLEDVDSQCRVS